MKTYDEYMDNIQKKAKKIKTRRRVIASSVTAAFVLVLCLTLFVPGGSPAENLNRYHNQILNFFHRHEKPNSDPQNGYDNLIKQLKQMSFGYDNGINIESPADGAPGDNMQDGSAGSSGTPESGESYVEVTDNQVSGVIEGDLFKRSNQYLYHLNGKKKLDVYSIAGEDSALVGTFDIKNAFEQMEHFDNLYITGGEMYLSEDCTQITLVLELGFRWGAAKTMTAVLSLDVSDPTDIRLTQEAYFEGYNASSRMIDGKLLLVYEYWLFAEPDYDDPTTFVPCYGTYEKNMRAIDASDIVCPEDPYSTSYTVMALLDADTAQILDTHAVFGGSGTTYVSRDAVYSVSMGICYGDDSRSWRDVMTVTGVSFGTGKLETMGSIKLDGKVKDQYSLDEYDGTLRVAASTRSCQYKFVKDEDDRPMYASAQLEKNCSLYCIDLSTWALSASIVGFAPDGEEVTSARFDGANAYICTAEIVIMSDPVYFFDLSDLSNITWKNTPIIDGYSSSLIRFGDALVGIGMNELGGLKIEAYAQGTENVESIACFERNASFSSEYKSYLIDRENGYIGIPISDIESDWNSEFLLLHFDGTQFVEVTRVSITYSLANVRATVIDGYLYVLSYNGGLQVVKL